MRRKRLDNDRVKALYDAFDLPETAWRSWFESYVRALEWGRDVDDATLRSADGQRRLWTDVGVSTLGSSENLNVIPLLTDPELVHGFVELRKRGRDPAASRRAKDLDGAHHKLFVRVDACTEHGKTPRARLIRAMHVLLPADFHCVLNDDQEMVVRDMLFGQVGQGRVENHVHARERLRQVLGDEPSLSEHARRAMFCWYLVKNADAIEAGAMPATDAGKEDNALPTAIPDAQDLLVPLPLSRQYRWLDVYKAGFTALELCLRECIQSQTLDTLTTALRDELELTTAHKRYLPNLLRDLEHLGLIQRDGDEYTITENGERVLDTGGTDVLAEALAVHIKGFAYLIKKLQVRPHTSTEIHVLLEPFTTEAGRRAFAQRHLWWGQLAGLFIATGTTKSLTPYGAGLAARIPEQHVAAGAPAPAPLDADGEDEIGSARPQVSRHPDLPTVWAAFEHLAATRGILFTKAQVRALHTAWAFGERKQQTPNAVKRFAILSGLSGTGKTQLLICYADAVCEAMGLDPDEHIALVPVRPDWRDPSGLLGYFNALHAEPTFQAEPALRLVIRASKHPHLPFFLLLDEMNLARVERYFAPFLSAMEVGGSIDLHAFDEPVNGVPSTVRWPSNLRIGGTVNMDETTHAFSDKVLDRAFTLEFWDVDIEGFFAARPTRQTADAPIEQTLRAVQACLRPIRRHVGYRTLGEVLDWVASAREADPDATPQDLADQALFSKVLPRLRGHETAGLHEALEALAKLTKEHALPICHEKITTMHARLRDTGVTGFWS